MGELDPSDMVATGDAGDAEPQGAAADAARAATLALLDTRAATATLCPSEVARALDGAKWRAAMPAVHAAVDRLLVEGRVRLSWKGAPLASREGPYRIGRAGRLPPGAHG